MRLQFNDHRFIPECVLVSQVSKDQRWHQSSTLYDVTTQIFAFVYIKEVTVHDMKAMSLIPYEFEVYYIIGRDYINYKRLYKITQLNPAFVVIYKNMKYRC